MSTAKTPVLLLKGPCQMYGHTHFFLEYMKAAFQELGCTAVQIDLTSLQLTDEVWTKLKAFNPQLILCFNLHGVSAQDPQGLPFGEKKVPVLSWMVDHYYYHPAWFEPLRLPHVHTVWPDSECMEDAKKLKLPSFSYLPLGGRRFLKCREEDREIDMFMAGTITDPNAFRARWSTIFSPAIQKLAEGIAEEWSMDLRRRLPRIFRKFLKRFGLKGHPAVKKIEATVLSEVNRYVRSQKRLEVAKRLKSLPLTVVGDGWEQVVPDSKWHFLGSRPYPLVEELVANSRINVVIHPISPRGTSERYFCALGNGSALVTNENEWLRENYVPDEEYIPYALNDTDALAETIRELHANRERRLQMTSRAAKRTHAEHLWYHRAKHLLELSPTLD